MTAPTKSVADSASDTVASTLPGGRGARAWRFSDCVLEPEKRQLSNAEGLVAAEPQVVELLIYLLENRDRLVSKQDLVTHVWQGRHVTDAAISAGVKKARAAVGDDGSAGRVIATIYGRGYRFVAAVEAVRPIGEPEVTVAPLPADGGRSRPATRMSRWLPALLARGRTGGWRLPAVVVLLPALIALAVLVARPDRGRQPSRFAIGALALPLGLDSGVAEQMLDALREELAAVETIALLPALGEHPRTLEALARTAQDHGAEAALALRLVPAMGSGPARMSLHLVQLADDGNRMVQLVEYPIELANEQGRRAVLRVAVKRAKAVVEVSFGRRSGESEARAEARRLALDALGSWRVSCRDRELLGLLAYAVERDPTFAQGWYALALTRASIAHLCLEGRTVLPLAFEALAEARRLAPEWSEPLQLEVALLQRTGREERSMTLLLAGLAREPDSFFLHVRAAEVLRYAGQLARSQAVLEALERREPGVLGLMDIVPYPALYRGDWSAFLAQTSRRESAYFAYYRAFARWRLGRDEEALRDLEQATASDPSDVFAHLAGALAAIVTGDWEAARDRLEQLDRRRLTEGPPDGEMTYKVAQLLSLAGDRERAVSTLDRAVTEGFVCTACIRADPAWPPRVADPALAELFEAVVERARSRERAFADRWLAELAAALGLADFDPA